MLQGYSITPQPQAGQQGPAWIRWLDRYAQEHAAAVAQIAVRDFPAMVREQITQEADGESMTPSTMQLVVTLLARLGATHGLRQVPFTLEDIAMLTQALVLEHALTTLHTDAVIGAFHVDDPETGRASPLGAALTQWLAAVRAAPGASPPPRRRHATDALREECTRCQLPPPTPRPCCGCRCARTRKKPCRRSWTPGRAA